MILTTGRHGYARWYPAHPIAEARRTHMGMQVQITPGVTTHQDMFNVWPDFDHKTVPLCQIQLV